MTHGYASRVNSRKTGSNTVREIGRVVGVLHRFVYTGAAAKLVEGQVRLDRARGVHVAINETIEEVPNVKAARRADAAGITNDVYRAAIAEQMIPLRTICDFIDAL